MPSRPTIYAALASLILIWGTTWAAIDVSLEGIPPFTGIAIRFTLAGLLLLAVARCLGARSRPSRRLRWLWVVNTLFTFAIPYSVVYWSQQWVPSGLASVLFSTFPLLVAAMAHVALPGERLTPLGLLGMLAGLAGVAVLFSEDLSAIAGRQTYVAAAVLLLSPLAAAIGHVIVKRSGSDVRPIDLIAVPMLATGLLGLVPALLIERGIAVHFDARSVGALVYLTLFGSAVSFCVYFWLLARLTATRLSLITYAIPIVAVLVGTLFLDEPFTARILLGALLVVSGVALASRPAATR